MEKAKETKAPPPAARPQPDIEFGSSMLHEKALPPIPSQRVDLGQSKPSRMNPGNQRQQEDPSRPVNSVVSNSAKLPAKRPLPQDNEDHHSRPTLQRNGPSYHQQEHQAKRRRTSDDFDEDEDMTENHPKMTAPPIRQSSSRQKVREITMSCERALIHRRTCQRSRCSRVAMQMLPHRVICRDQHLLLSTI